MKGVPFFKYKVDKRVTFSAKMVKKRVRSWTSGQSLPVLNFVKVIPLKLFSYQTFLKLGVMNIHMNIIKMQ